MSDRLEALTRAKKGYWNRVLPSDNTSWQSVAATVAFGPFAPGTLVIIACDVAVHINSKATGGAAIATNPKIPAGVHDFVIPTIVVGGAIVEAMFVHVFANGAGNAAVWQAS